jgi:methionyl-tRNA formyltransferase
MRLVFMGTPEFAVPSLKALLDSGEEIAAVVTQPDRPRRSRSSPPAPSPVKIEAIARGLPILQPESVRDLRFLEALRKVEPRLIVVVAFGQILPEEILSLPPRWCINVHASNLPRYRGAAPIARAILAGERVTGCTTMKMDRGLDTGDILLQRECAIGLNETAGELTSRLAKLGAGLLVETLARHARGTLEPRRQDAREATPAPPLVKEDGRIDWGLGADEIANRVRACNPWPLAFSHLRGEGLQILRAEVSFEPVGRSKREEPPGRILSAERERILVQCGGDSRLGLLELRFPGRRSVSAADAVNGRLLRAGDTLSRSPAG